MSNELGGACQFGAKIKVVGIFGVLIFVIVSLVRPKQLLTNILLPDISIQLKQLFKHKNSLSKGHLCLVYSLGTRGLL